MYSCGVSFMVTYLGAKHVTGVVARLFRGGVLNAGTSKSRL
jgi:hypothetical protein